jgi:Flp pilus assembly protein TadD
MACGVLAYSNALSGPFILDDATAVVNNRSIESLALPGPLRTPSDTPVARRPLVNLSLALNYAADGRDVRGYHAVNLLVHLLASLALFGIVRRTLVLPALQPGFGGAATDVALVAALVWVLHPLNSEVVDYVTQRSQSMMGLFYFVTLYCAIRATGARHAWRWDVAAAFACAAGVLCKESMVTAPVMVLWYDRTFLSGSWRELARRRRLYAGLALSWTLLAALMATSARTTAGLGSGVTPQVYLLNQVQLIPHYLYLAVWPRALVVDYGMARPVSLQAVIAPAIVLALVAGAAVLLLVRKPRAGFAAAWFFVTLAPASSFVPIATEVGAERRMYLPLAGLVVLAVTAGFLAARRLGVRGRVLTVGCVMACMLLGIGTLLRNHEYRDPLTLARATVARRPTGRGRFVLGSVLLERGRREEGLSQLRESAVNYAGGHYALGLALVDHDPNLALEHLHAFIRLTPHDSAVRGARDLIGRVLLQRGDIAAAEQEFQALLADYPRDTRAIVFLGDIRWRQQRLAEAIALYQRAHAIDAGVGRDRGVMGRLAAALVAVNRVPEGERVLAEAIAANPGDPFLLKMRGRTLAMVGRYAEAAESFRGATAVAPQDSEARSLLAAAERRLGLTRGGAK